MARVILCLVILASVACRSPTSSPKRLPTTDERLLVDAQEAVEIVPPSREPLRVILADHLELTDVHGPEIPTYFGREPGFLFCATARSPGSVDVGLRDPERPSSAGRVTVEVQPRGEPRAVRFRDAQALVNVGDQLCLFVPPSDRPWEWFRPDPADRPRSAPRVELGPLRPADGVTYERAASLAPTFVDPQRVRVGDEEEFSHVRFTAAEEGARYYGVFLSVTASRAERVRAEAWMVAPNDGPLDTVQLRPGDTLTLSRDELEPGRPIPGLEGL